MEINYKAERHQAEMYVHIMTKFRQIDKMLNQKKTHAQTKKDGYHVSPTTPSFWNQIDKLLTSIKKHENEAPTVTHAKIASMTTDILTRKQNLMEELAFVGLLTTGSKHYGPKLPEFTSVS